MAGSNPCCCKLSTGVTTIGVILMIFSLYFLVQSAVFVSNGYDENVYVFHYGSDDVGHYVKILQAKAARRILAYSIVSLLFSLILLEGVYKKNATMVLTWLVYEGFCFFWDAIHAIILAYYVPHPAVYFYVVFVLAFHAYILMVVIAYFNELAEPTLPSYTNRCHKSASSSYKKYNETADAINTVAAGIAVSNLVNVALY